MLPERTYTHTTCSATVDSLGVYTGVYSFGFPEYAYTGREHKPEFFDPNTVRFDTSIGTLPERGCVIPHPVAFDFDVNLMEQLQWFGHPRGYPLRYRGPKIHIPRRTCHVPRTVRRMFRALGQQALRGNLEVVEHEKQENQGETEIVEPAEEGWYGVQCHC